MKQTKEPVKVIDTALLTKILGAVPSSQDTTGQGVVISANWWGKAKTIVQVAAIFFAIGFDPTPVAVDVLLYVAVVITVVSGIDYFFGLRRLLREADARRQAGASLPAASSHSRIDV